MIRLFIKGSQSEAALALAMRDIPILEDLKEYPPFNECLAKVHDAQGAKVRAWFHASSPFAPFPSGTLMYFHETELAELLNG